MHARVCVSVCVALLSRFQSSPPSRSSPTLSSTRPPSHIAASLSTAVLATGGGRGGESARLKEHLEAEESELFEVKGVLQAKVGCVSMCVHDTLCNSYATDTMWGGILTTFILNMSVKNGEHLSVCLCVCVYVCVCVCVCVCVLCVWWSETM